VSDKADLKSREGEGRKTKAVGEDLIPGQDLI